MTFTAAARTHTSCRRNPEPLVAAKLVPMVERR